MRSYVTFDGAEIGDRSSSVFPEGSVFPQNSGLSATQDQWTDWRGKKVEWQAQVLFMDQELEKLDCDTDALVKKYAAELLDGIAGALTHGIIHAGWA